MQKPIQQFLILFLAALPFCAAMTGCSHQKIPLSPQLATTSPSAAAANAEASMDTKIPETRAAFRIKAGNATPFTDSSGNVWRADQGFDGGDTIDRDPGTAIAGSKDPSLFLSEHYGMNSFSGDVPNGKYIANLYFAETFDGITGPGQRVFSFTVQGHTFKDFDVWVKAGGPNKAYMETVPVDVTNGVFHIDFTSNIENPEINAIELIPQP